MRMRHLIEKCKLAIKRRVRGFINKNRTVVLDLVSNDLPEIIAVAHPEYRGVKSATKEMVNDIFEVSNIYNQQTAKKIAKKISQYNPKKVLISGYAIGYDLLAKELKKTMPEVGIFVLIHSAFIWFDVYPNENQVFKRFIDMAKSGIIEKVGFCKNDLAEYFKSQGINAYFVMNRFYPEKHEFRKISDTKIKIGIFGKNMWHRNITNQTIGATMVENTEVHVNEISDHFFIDKKRVISHGILPKNEFLDLYKTLDINMYISLTECFPMSVIESMQYGIPCLVSDTSDVYKWSQKLKNWLTVSTIDSPIGISNKIKEVILNYNDIQIEIKNYIPILKNKTEESISEFLK